MRARDIGHYSYLANKLYELTIRYDACRQADSTSKDSSATILETIDNLARNRFHLFSAMYRGKTALARLALEGHVTTARWLADIYCLGDHSQILIGRAIAGTSISEFNVFDDEHILLGYAQGGHKELVEAVLNKRFHGAAELMVRLRLPVIAGYARGLHFALLEEQLQHCHSIRGEACHFAVQNFALLGLFIAPRTAIHLLTLIQDKELANVTAMIAETHLQINQDSMQDEFSAASLLYRAYSIKRVMAKRNCAFGEAFNSVKPRLFAIRLFSGKKEDTQAPSSPEPLITLAK